MKGKKKTASNPERKRKIEAFWTRDIFGDLIFPALSNEELGERVLSPEPKTDRLGGKKTAVQAKGRFKDRQKGGVHLSMREIDF